MTDAYPQIADRAAVAALLRDARLRRGWSLDELGRRSSVSPTTISRLEGEQMGGRLNTLVLLTKPLELTADALARAYCGTPHRARSTRPVDLPAVRATVDGAGAERLGRAAYAARNAAGLSVLAIPHIAPITVRKIEAGAILGPRVTTVLGLAASIAPDLLHATLFRAFLCVYAGEQLTLEPELLGRLQVRRAR